MTSATISRSQARRIAVHASGLHKNAPYGRGVRGTEKTIAELGYVQIDTISVIQRAHHHILKSRVPNYSPALINKMQFKRKTIFEYWAHAAAYLPSDAYRFSLPLKDFFRKGKDRWPKSDQKLMKEVLQRVEQEGPLMARDFERSKAGSGTGWWDWKPAKLALERLFFQGDLMIAERRGFQKVYDLPERILPASVSTLFPSDEEFAKYLIDDALRRFGIASVAEICYIRKGIKSTVKQVVTELLESGELISIKVHRDNESIYYAPKWIMNRIPRIYKGLKILSPFDPLVIQRKRLKNIFDFEYLLECYVPKPKRKFGYFTLPILYGPDLIGRMDAKADRATNTLHIYRIELEKAVAFERIPEQQWRDEMVAFALFNGCQKIRVHTASPRPLRNLLKSMSREKFA